MSEVVCAFGGTKTLKDWLERVEDGIERAWCCAPEQRLDPLYSRGKPDAKLTPTIIGQYDLRPEGGRKRMDEAPFFWCCHCQKDNHWLGYGITNETGQSYSIGKDCAAAHYGVEFTRIRRNFVELSNRRGVLERLGRIVAASDHVRAAIATILRSPGLAAIDAKRNEITKAHPNAAFLLSAAANSGSVMQEDIQVRDVAAERKCGERLGERDPKTPIYRSERSGLVPLEGRSLMRTQAACRDLLIALRFSINAAVRLERGDTNAVTTKDLTKVVRAVEEAHAGAMESVAAARRAHRFFSDRNLDRVERWSASHRDFSIVRRAHGLEIRSPDGDRRAIARIEPFDLPDLPGFNPFTEISAQGEGAATTGDHGLRILSPASSAWPADRIERLRTLWMTGMTAADIGRDLGGVSRNAVIGKAKRLGLPFRNPDA